MSSQLGRRAFLRHGLTVGGLALAAPAVLTACVSGGDGDGSRFGIASQRLAWVKNTQFAGSYLADRNGYYVQEGFSGADLVSGGPTAPPIESDVLSRTFTGVSQVPIVGSAVAKGAPLKIIGAVYARNANCIMSMGASPIETPQDLYGRTIGCSSSSEPVWRNFVAALGLDASRITTVPVQGDPIGMTTGEIDGYVGFVNNQVVDLRGKGFDIHAMLLADVGFPLVGQTYITTQDVLDNDREKVKAFLRAEVRGWKDVLADPQHATDLTVNDYGRTLGLDPRTTLDACIAGNELIRTGEPGQRVIDISDATVEANVRAIAAGGLDLSPDTLFDLGPIREVHQEDPALALA
ncbi:Hydroxymethylpyrimidine ABC transporter, substrate-binding component [Pseudonocardia sp. Ae717_Ps2]|uniref:ABC transporter substrate-binding protein n=1 Tax=Pseudonocardia sp. Ae717_Ps2 TaxID=1885573 RepID=UPI00094ADF86|nr:ABC transporter substrate-binding protein [Pseudonocardia sp. Ae717_Ps2]OLM34249.1 Hydroxymethylpyrimidine ABC transporter, substrate-binding component [Pseudonocardia sp. Ae717_Ps2]